MKGVNIDFSWVSLFCSQTHTVDAHKFIYKLLHDFAFMFFWREILVGIFYKEAVSEQKGRYG